MTIATLKRIDAGLSAAERAKLRVLLVSVDPERDTPEALARLAAERQLDTTRWSLAHAQAGDVRKLAAVLGVQYRQLADKEFNHSTLLALISREGRIVAKSSSTGALDPQLVDAVRKVLAEEHRVQNSKYTARRANIVAARSPINSVLVCVTR